MKLFTAKKNVCCFKQVICCLEENTCLQWKNNRCQKGNNAWCQNIAFADIKIFFAARKVMFAPKKSLFSMQKKLILLRGFLWTKKIWADIFERILRYLIGAHNRFGEIDSLCPWPMKPIRRGRSRNDDDFSFCTFHLHCLRCELIGRESWMRERFSKVPAHQRIFIGKCAHISCTTQKWMKKRYVCFTGFTLRSVFFLYFGYRGTNSNQRSPGERSIHWRFLLVSEHWTEKIGSSETHEKLIYTAEKQEKKYDFFFSSDFYRKTASVYTSLSVFACQTKHHHQHHDPCERWEWDGIFQTTFFLHNSKSAVYV